MTGVGAIGLGTETAKIRETVQPMMVGRTVLDLGCGPEKVVPWAVGVDDHSEGPVRPLPAVDIEADVSPNSDLAAKLSGRTFDVVFSSHALEHVRYPIRETLAWWLGFVAPGGRLVLYLPDERHYVFDPAQPWRRSPFHVHYLTLDTFVWHLENLRDVAVEVAAPDVGPDRYSFLVVLRKLG